MLVEFFNNKTEQSFLKALLSAVQMPKFTVVNFGDLIFNGYFYIFDKHIIKCTKTGTLKRDNDVVIGQYSIGSTAEYEEIDHYNFCTEDQNIEFKEIIRASYYSTELHKRLGQYLRCIRDLRYIDLMGMYNCFSYEIFKKIHIDENTLSIDDGSLSSKKLLAIPVKYNQKYTIAITSSSPVYMAFCIKLPNGIKPINYKISSEFVDKKLLSARNLGILRFEEPIVVSTQLDEDQGDLYRYNDNLYMILQVSANNKSSLVVLEGDYTKSRAITVVNSQSKIPQWDRTTHSYSYTYAPTNTDTVSLIYNPELLNFNSGYQFAYSNALIPYLVNNVIANDDVVGENITYAKKLLGFKDTINYWSNDIKYSAFVKYLFDKIEFSKDDQGYYVQPKTIRKDCFDITGYIDKNIEGWLNA